MAQCRVSPFQEPASAVPGNIGIITAKFLVWSNDPLFTRPHQQTTYPFTNVTADQVSDACPNASFELNSVFLRPIYELHDMWIATIKKTGEKTFGDDGTTKSIYKLDFVPCPAAVGKFPGVTITNDSIPNLYELDGRPNITDINQISPSKKSDDTSGKSIFLHQTWVHVGNLLKRQVALHPSEYNVNLQSTEAINSLSSISTNGLATNRSCEDYFTKFTLSELQSAPKWQNKEILDGSTGKRVFWPTMISKQVPDDTSPVHWTLEKLTKVWQGQDFFVHIELGDQKTDDAVDSHPEDDCVDTDTDLYKYLIYNPNTLPTGTDVTDPTASWVEGISNEAFYIPPKNVKTGTESDFFPDFDDARKQYWWRYKTYILIEIGHADPQHNYFIELVKGRKPRFLHLGEEWDNTKRLIDGATITADDFKFIKKCRVLSEFESLSCDELFKKTDFRVSVRNHLGKIVVTFQGYENTPWVINRQDNAITDDGLLVKQPSPMIVPCGKMRIHGGNISCSFGYAPTRYTHTEQIDFTDRQADTGDAQNKDLYITFAQIGNSEKHRSEIIKRRYFNDVRLSDRKFGYDLDAYQSLEIIKNKTTLIPVYKLFPSQYKPNGKGWVTEEFPVNESFGLPPGIVTTNRLDPKFGGVPHTVSIVNAKRPGRPFTFGLTDQADATYPYKDYVSRWDVGVVLNAGSVVMPKFEHPELLPDFVEVGDDKFFEDYVTPIVKSWTLFVLGGGKVFEGKLDPIDITPIVSSISDSWSAQDFSSINHEMHVRCYIPDSILPITDQNDEESQLDENPEPNIHALGQQLLALHAQKFYVTVSYWWKNGVGERDAPGNIIPRTTTPDESDLLIQMSGIAQGCSLERSANKLFMDFTVKDYSVVLEDNKIFNSPFFDGVSDSVAVYELARMAGFDDSRIPRAVIDRRPLGFLQKVIEDPNIPECDSFIYNGEQCIFRSYDLPGSYSDLANPSVKFQNGESYWSAMIKIAQLSSKVIYFDRWGVLRLENSPAIEAAFNSGEEQVFQPKFQFVTTPFPLSITEGDDGLLNTNRFEFDPNKHVSHLVWEVVKYNRSVEDCVNQIILFTASNDIQLSDGSTSGGFIIEGYTFFDQIYDPTAEGFLGYRKIFYQSNGLFGGEEGVRRGIQHYAKMKYPPAEVQFQTYSVPGLKPLDIITLDDNLFYIKEISHELDPESNKSWMNITGEWFKPFLGTLGFLEERGPNTSGTATTVGA